VSVLAGRRVVPPVRKAHAHPTIRTRVRSRLGLAPGHRLPARLTTAPSTCPAPESNAR
jgi:hypothetical protein